jgi:hypothetical protein
MVEPASDLQGISVGFSLDQIGSNETTYAV